MTPQEFARATTDIYNKYANEQAVADREHAVRTREIMIARRDALIALRDEFGFEGRDNGEGK